MTDIPPAEPYVRTVTLPPNTVTTVTAYPDGGAGRPAIEACDNSNCRPGSFGPAADLILLLAVFVLGAIPAVYWLWRVVPTTKLFRLILLLAALTLCGVVLDGMAVSFILGAGEALQDK